MEINELVENYIGGRILKGYSEVAEKRGRYCLRQFTNFLAEQGIHEAESLSKEVLKDLQEYLAFKTTKQGRFLTPKSRNTFLERVKSFLKWLKKEDLIATNLDDCIDYVRLPKILPQNILTPDEMEYLLSIPLMTTARGVQDRLIMEILYGTGLRSKELCQLKIEDVETKQHYLHVKEGKGNKDRVVPLSEGVCQLFNYYVAHVRNKFMPLGAKHDYVFPGREGHVTNDFLWKRIKFYAKKSGIKKRIYVHGFRHACATHMLQNGAPIRCVQELLGHASINATQIYTHVTITDLKKAHAKYHPRERKKIEEENVALKVTPVAIRS